MKKIVLKKFKDEDQERDYWDKIDLSEHLDKKLAKKVIFPNLKPT